MPSAKFSRYIELFILGLATIFASIELGLTIHERIRINDLAGSSATHDLDYIMFFKAGLLATPKPRIVYFVLTAILWVSAGVLWKEETKNHGCDFGHNMCGTNKTIQGIAWMQALKHIIGTLTSFKKMRSEANQADNGKLTGEFDDNGMHQKV
ncbi:hypothetical protein FRB97_001797 [Tulasnella sp. 331]|nr:hypothetical protein FRB97_001797 [Tulasnella sp. 331]